MTTPLTRPTTLRRPLNICYAGEIGDRFLEVLYTMPRQLVLSTEGGDIYTMRAAVDLLRHRRMTIIGTACVFSAGVTILAAAHRRLATASTRFMVHHAAGKEMQGTARDVESERNEMSIADSFILDVLVERTKKNRAFWARLVDKSAFFGAEEALEWGLIDQVI